MPVFSAIGFPRVVTPCGEAMGASRHVEDRAAVDVRLWCPCGSVVRREVGYAAVIAGEVLSILAEMATALRQAHEPPSLSTLTDWGWFCPEAT